MSQLAVDRILGRLVTDSDFRADFYEDAQEVCRRHGLELTQAELSALLGIAPQVLQTLTDNLDPRIVRAPNFRMEKSEVRTGRPRNRAAQRGTR